MVERYIERLLEFTVKIGQGSFGDSSTDELSFSGLRATAQVELATSAPPVGLFRLYGLSLSHVNQLSRSGLNWESRNNQIRARAGDALSGMATIFDGQIFQAYPDFNTQPEVSFVIVGSSGRPLQMNPTKPASFEGATDAATIFGQLAKQAGLSLENNGVNVKLDNPYLPGSVWEQIDRAARAANCFFHVDRVRGVLAIWSKDSSRSGDTVTISPGNGMIGYPEFQQVLIRVKTLYDPSITLDAGLKIKVESQLQAASGTWNIVRVGHNLASKMPDGPWETHIEGARAQ